MLCNLLMYGLRDEAPLVDHTLEYAILLAMHVWSVTCDTELHRRNAVAKLQVLASRICSLRLAPQCFAVL